MPTTLAKPPAISTNPGASQETLAQHLANKVKGALDSRTPTAQTLVSAAANHAMNQVVNYALENPGMVKDMAWQATGILFHDTAAFTYGTGGGGTTTTTAITPGGHEVFRTPHRGGFSHISEAAKQALKKATPLKSRARNPYTDAGQRAMKLRKRAAIFYPTHRTKKYRTWSRLGKYAY